MSTITREWLQQAINDYESVRDELPFGLDDYQGNILAALRIALASLEAEPIGAFHIAEQQVDGTSDYIKDGEWLIDNGIIEVYAAPPVPVVPAALPENDDEDGHDIDYLEPSEVYALGRTAGWNACRAAMLQAEPVSNSDELPLDYLQGHKDGLEWAAQLAEANHPQTGDWLYDDPIDLARAIRKGPDMPTVQGGNSPVIPDDVRRMDWLVSKTVDVREPMVYGSHSLFWSQTITDEEDDYHATKLREQIDAAMAAEQAAAPQQEAE
ncbi:hypothetical protein [Escherichia coli]|uniref:hypothetical protein n=1 Tax=Escherichia coli TaxID=562 RepID=UPI001CDB206B|nr:hypothetical protein [Escherichia coli]